MLRMPMTMATTTVLAVVLARGAQQPTTSFGKHANENSIRMAIKTGPETQTVGNMVGTVTDTNMSVMPGVKISVTTSGLQRSTVTDRDGRFQFTDLPVGTYTAIAELTGFETDVKENIVVSPGRITSLAFALRVGCINEAQLVDLGLVWALRTADTIVQIRISETKPPERCPVTGWCVCAEHAAVVKRILKAPSQEMLLNTIRFLQEGAGRIEHGRAGAEEPYIPGDEFIAFLHARHC